MLRRRATPATVAAGPQGSEGTLASAPARTGRAGRYRPASAVGVGAGVGSAKRHAPRQGWRRAGSERTEMEPRRGCAAGFRALSPGDIVDPTMLGVAPARAE